MTATTHTLIFVYNANGGWLNALRDAVHKAASPATYPCSLCALTYGLVSTHREWRSFLGRLGLPVLFLYRDEFRHDLDNRDLPLPAVLIGGHNSAPELLVSAAELDALPDLAALIALVEARMAGVSG
ncbi:MAG: hypothetical protein K2Q29_12155 [Sphingomonadales bacterium]|nr:hypothetical protein [Sphingomonadales bacterium]